MENIVNHLIRKDNIEYIIQLIRIAKSDDFICEKEMDFLYRIGKDKGFTVPEINSLIETKGTTNYIAPNEVFKCFEQIYGIVQMALIDGIIDKKDMHFINSYAINLGFKEGDIPNLILLLISGIKQGVSEEDLYETYKMGKKS